MRLWPRGSVCICVLLYVCVNIPVRKLRRTNNPSTATPVQLYRCVCVRILTRPRLKGARPVLVYTCTPVWVWGPLLHGSAFAPAATYTEGCGRSSPGRSHLQIPHRSSPEPMGRFAAAAQLPGGHTVTILICGCGHSRRWVRLSDPEMLIV